MTEYLEVLIVNYGLIAIFFLMIANGFVSTPPSEVTLSLSGVLVARYDHTFASVFATAVLGNLIGTYILYWVARFFGHRWLFDLKAYLERSRRRFLRFFGGLIPDEPTYELLASKFRDGGTKWVCIFRCFPLVRSVISIPAGVMKMDNISFLLFSLVGISIWAVGWQSLGYFTVNNWSKYRWYISAPLLAVCVALVILLKKKLTNYLYLQKGILTEKSS